MGPHPHLRWSQSGRRCLIRCLLHAAANPEHQATQIRNTVRMELSLIFVPLSRFGFKPVKRVCRPLSYSSAGEQWKYHHDNTAIPGSSHADHLATGRLCACSGSIRLTTSSGVQAAASRCISFGAAPASAVHLACILRERQSHTLDELSASLIEASIRH